MIILRAFFHVAKTSQFCIREKFPKLPYLSIMLNRAGIRFLGQSFLKRTTFSSRSCHSVNIPSNLQLADVKVLAEPVKPIISQDSMDYWFPSLNTPSTVQVFSFQNPGRSITDASIDSRVFGVALRKDLVHETIRYQRHKKRQPKKTKTMSEISGSNKKPRPQKGSGSSQVGHKRNSAWRGGAKAHGPVIRDYSIGLNRRVRAMAMMITLAAKLREGNLIVFDELKCEVRCFNLWMSSYILLLFHIPN